MDWENFYSSIYKANGITPGVGASMDMLPDNMKPKADGVGGGTGTLNQLMTLLGVKRPTGSNPLTDQSLSPAERLNQHKAQIDNGEITMSDLPINQGGFGDDILTAILGRGAIIIVGLIFIAVGLMMFKPGVVIEAAKGLGDAAGSA